MVISSVYHSHIRFIKQTLQEDFSSTGSPKPYLNRRPGALNSLGVVSGFRIDITLRMVDSVVGVHNIGQSIIGFPFIGDNND